MNFLTKLFSHNPKNILLAGKTFMLLAAIKLGLLLLPFARLRKLLSSFNGGANDILGNPAYDIKRIIWAVDVSTRYMPGGAKCLARALTTEVLMARHGYIPELRIGVAKTEKGKLEAHAWIESQGKILIGQLEDLDRFQVLPLPTKGVKSS